jgi:recombination protein RecT
MGWKGFVQLAQRTGQYTSINVVEVYESQFESFNPLTEEIKADFTAKPEGGVVGYCGYFKLINGFTKTVYWTIEQAETHAKKYSKSFNQKSGPWQQHFDAMAKKTVLKNMLSKWGILSIEMQKAVTVDQGVIIEQEDELTIDANYVDAPEPDEEEPNEVDAETFGQIKEGIEKGTTTLNDVAQYYDISEGQREQLEKIKVKSK